MRMISLRIFSASASKSSRIRSDALVLAHQAEKDVLRSDVVVAQRESLAQRQLEHFLGTRRERDLAGGDLVALADDACDLGPDFLHRNVEGLQNAGGKALLFTEQAEEDVLGADVVVFERPRLILRENHDLPCPFGESLEQLLRRSFPQFSGGRRVRRAPGPKVRGLIVADWSCAGSHSPGSPGGLGTLLDR
jgi:hypothetical protein